MLMTIKKKTINNKLFNLMQPGLQYNFGSTNYFSVDFYQLIERTQSLNKEVNIKFKYSFQITRKKIYKVREVQLNNKYILYKIY